MYHIIIIINVIILIVLNIKTVTATNLKLLQLIDQSVSSVLYLVSVSCILGAYNKYII